MWTASVTSERGTGAEFNASTGITEQRQGFRNALAKFPGKG